MNQIEKELCNFWRNAYNLNLSTWSSAAIINLGDSIYGFEAIRRDTKIN